jgi:hypothetical protein
MVFFHLLKITFYHQNYGLQAARMEAHSQALSTPEEKFDTILK